MVQEQHISGKFGCLKVVVGAVLSIPVGLIIGIGLLAIISKALAGLGG